MTDSPKLAFPDLKGRVAIITGSTRGIGRACALALASRGCNIVVAAKSTVSTPNLPGSIFTVADEVRALGVDALPCKLDLRKAETVKQCVDDTVAKFGRVDIVILNASALWWHTIEETPIEKYDLITSINTRGHFYLCKLCMPYMKKNKYGRVIGMCPPIRTDYQAYKGFTAYNISKMGMTMVAMGVAAEGEGHNITGFSLWPATVIESQASINFKLMDRKYWRKATILSDSVVSLCGQPASYTGKQLYDDEYLLSQGGLTKEDLAVYRCDPSYEPPRALALGLTQKASIRRGDVRKVAKDGELSPKLPSPKL